MEIHCYLYKTYCHCFYLTSSTVYLFAAFTDWVDCVPPSALLVYLNMDFFVCFTAMPLDNCTLYDGFTQLE